MQIGSKRIEWIMIMTFMGINMDLFIKVLVTGVSVYICIATVVAWYMHGEALEYLHKSPLNKDDKGD